jgi:hypothetical protein
MCTLKDWIEFGESPEDFEICLTEGENGGDEKGLRFQDESGLDTRGCDSFFIAGFEWGANVLIHARSLEAAWEAWVDELKPIPREELPEAYGITDGAFADAWRKEHPLPSGAGGYRHRRHGLLRLDA